MLLLGLVLLALLATSSVQSGLPHHTQSRWALIDVNPQTEAPEEQLLTAEEDYWPDVELEMVNLVSLEDQISPTSPELYVDKEQEPEGGVSVVWKISLVAVVLLVSVLGCLSLAYYLCVWRGGRLHYRLQKAHHAFI